MTALTTATLSTRALLVNLTIHQWSATRHNAQVTQEVATQHGSDAKMGAYRQRLIHPRHLEPVKTALGAIYLEHRRRTLPWLDDGARILSSAGYFDYMQWFNSATAELELTLQSFYSGYSGYISEAQIALNGLFDPGAYPSPSELERLFGVDLRKVPVPDVSDFRIEIGDAEINRLRTELAGSLESVTALAMSDVRSRIENAVGAMVAKLAGYTGGKAGSFRDSLVGNMRDLVEILPSLNLTNDPKLDDLTERLRHELCIVDPDVLRADEPSRVAVLASAESILESMADFI
jgi:hypothetical protein